MVDSTEMPRKHIGQAKSKPLTDALLYIGNREPGPKGKLGMPRKPTAFQVAARAMIQEAIKGNVAAFNTVADRVEGKIALPIMGGPEDAPPIKTQDITIQEAARRLAFIFLRAEKLQQQEAAAKKSKA